MNDVHEKERNIHFVKFFIELIELGRLCHLIFVHEEGWLDFLVLFRSEIIQAIRNESLIKINAIVCEVVTSMTSNFGSYATK